MKTMVIGNKVITDELNKPPIIIAEAGVNHEGSMDKALEMIEQAAKGGADAIKFQSYKAERLASKNSPAYWDLSQEKSINQYNLFKQYDQFGEEEYAKLAAHCKNCGIIFLSTPFDYEMVDILDKYVPAFKIASADLTNLPFVKYIAMKNKPILLSTGAATIAEIWEAVETAYSLNNNNIILFHCILNYPTSYHRANLGMIADLKNKFPEHLIGYSDHTMPNKMNEILGYAWLLGARIIEKHFTLNKDLPGNDHYHAMNMMDLLKLKEHFEAMEDIVGSVNKKYIYEEEASRNYARRSLVSNCFITAGNKIKENDIVIKRPGTGVPPKLFDLVIGSIAIKDIKPDQIIQYGDFKVIDK